MSETTLEQFRAAMFPGIPLNQLCKNLTADYYEQFLKSDLTLTEYIDEMLLAEF